MELRKIKNWNVLLYYIGILAVIIGVILLLPLSILPFYKNEMNFAISFICPSLVCIILGVVLVRIFKCDTNKNLSVGEDAVIVVSAWILATVFSAIPFMISQNLNFTQAYFESVSGWTTTGLSVIDVESTPHIFLIYRSIMQFFGGVGIVLVMVSALSSTFGMKLYNSEGHSDKILPNLIKSSRMILSIYLGYVIAGTALYVITGMPIFDAINHSIAALSTGGFSTKLESIGFYDNVYIELITIILMILGTISFATHVLLVKGRFKEILKIGEIRFMFLILGIAIPLITFVSLKDLYGGLYKGCRVALFEIVSALSTTGFSTVGYNNWPPFAMFIMIILMITGGGAGSTSGGIKLYRVYLMMKQLVWNIKSKFLPEHFVKKHYVYKAEGKVIINKDDVIEIYNYICAYIVIFVLGVATMLAYKYPLHEAMFEFSSALGTVGLSVGITSPTAPSLILWVEIIGMLLGRLEIWVIFIAIFKIAKKAITK
ncbi:TrkH family potassium uptake protein [Romboutsia ilealis]|uniref:TrkH family potassium uptake protein n=1 Tax=Romboutsia faecis TaxID=2764597 RepID=A0ABR7JR86_9FIRM|nr:TrkH family potassium uptake protein [Romboutsia faecis]MBC5997425.1 TrkH family potassium uptake protein [Romboutsia faecis]MRN24942.1 TrkH family potassium uptake protein [Romboutsia ilealis]